MTTFGEHDYPTHTLRIAGVCQCWTSGFIKDLVVHPRKRNQGIAIALLLHSFNVFKVRGAESVDLKVHENNPTGADKLYSKVGMKVIERIARFIP